MNEQQIRYEVLNRRHLKEEHIAELRARAGEHFGLLLDLMTSEPLTKLQTENGLIVLFSLRRDLDVSDAQLIEYGDLLVHSLRSPMPNVSERARVILSNLMELDNLFAQTARFRMALKR